MIDRLLTFGFGQPWWLLLLLLVPLAGRLQSKPGPGMSLAFSSVDILRKMAVAPLEVSGKWRYRFRLLAIVLLILALARPHIAQGNSNDKKEGIDIVFCIDVSGSMDTKDFNYQNKEISRREALIMAIERFVDNRPNDRFGMIGFAKNTYMMSPLTIDGEWIKNVLKNIKTQGGTAIGDGIISSIDLLQQSKERSKVIVVVTDGDNNAGIAPMTAAEKAAAQHIRVHTIGITQLKSVTAKNAETSLLAKVADKTGGLFFQAANLEGMNDVYRQIDKMEKSRFEQRKYRVYDELYPWLILPVMLILLVTFIGNHTIWQRIP